MSLSLKDTYRLYEENTTNPVDFKTYIELCSKFMKFIIEKVFEGLCVPLPGRLGTLQIVGKKQKPVIGEDGEIKGLAPNWPATLKLWEKDPEAKKNKKLVYHTNYKTDGYRYKFFWSKKRVLVENKTLYTLKMTRANKRSVKDLILKGVPFKTIA
jgi:hypothetical protein